MTTPLVVWGSGGHARELRELVDDVNAARPAYELLGFLDDDADRHGREVDGLPVLGGIEWLRRLDRSACAVIGVGSPASRRRVALALEGAGIRSPVLVHPTAQVSRRAVLGEGCVVTALAQLSTSATLGRHVHLNLGASVSHDCRIDDFGTLAPGVRLSGAVVLGEGCDVGVGAVVLPGVAVGAWSVVGAGAVVTRGLEGDCTAVGVPARVVRRRPAGWHRAPGEATDGA